MQSSFENKVDHEKNRICLNIWNVNITKFSFNYGKNSTCPADKQGEQHFLGMFRMYTGV